ncbi:hypothetical protein [Bacillus sp. 165]|uniref:hypothetical protein n=1 Tax=Bacillus sp. 165 TaxID=1529117 RepID=UPI001ADA2F68|nr:hypothetical protein [Bacillus sp. 165]MBO9129207.1 hypothetical protein [Bacillus sp. 165]
MKKAIAFPSVTIIFLLALLFYQNMNMQTSLPSKGWSRSVTMDIQSEYLAKPILKKAGNVYEIYVPRGQGIAHATYDSKLHIQTKESIPVQVPSFSNLFIHNKQFVYLKDGNLILHDAVKETILDKEVTSFGFNKEQLIYWKENRAFELDTIKWESRLLAEFSSPIRNIVFDVSSPSFLIVLQETDLTTKFVVFEHEAEGGYKQTQLSPLQQIGSEKMQEVLFTQEGSRATIIYGTYSSAQGVRTYRAYEWQVDMNEPLQAPTTKLIKFRDENNGSAFENPRYLQVKKKQNNLVILFAADGQTVGKFYGTNIYEAKKEGDTWNAGRRSTTNDVALEPFFMGDNAIGWYTFSGKTYSLHAASTDAGVISKSEEITSSDWKSTFYNTLMALSGSFMITLLALIWVIAPIVLYIITYIVKTNEFEDNRLKWLPYAWIGLYIGSQLLFFYLSFDKKRLVFAPEYLTFTGSFILIPIILTVLSWGMLRFSQQEEWGTIKSASYFTIVNILLYMFLLGPYLL